MPSHEHKIGVCTAAFGDVLMGRNPSSARQRPVVHRNDPAIPQLIDHIEGQSHSDQRCSACQIGLFGHVWKRSGGQATVEDLGQRSSGSSVVIG